MERPKRLEARYRSQQHDTSPHSTGWLGRLLSWTQQSITDGGELSSGNTEELLVQSYSLDELMDNRPIGNSLNHGMLPPGVNRDALRSDWRLSAPPDSDIFQEAKRNPLPDDDKEFDQLFGIIVRGFKPPE